METIGTERCMDGVGSPLMWVILIVTLLINPTYIATHEPPSRVGPQL